MSDQAPVLETPMRLPVPEEPTGAEVNAILLTLDEMKYLNHGLLAVNRACAKGPLAPEEKLLLAVFGIADGWELLELEGR